MKKTMKNPLVLLSFLLLTLATSTTLFATSTLASEEIVKGVKAVKKMDAIKMDTIKESIKPSKFDGGLKEMLSNGKIKALPSGNMQYELSTGYMCETSNDTCICRGDASSEDCQAMFENMCNRDENGDPIYTCLPGGCTCQWRVTGGVGGGGSMDPAETLPVN